MKWKDLFKSNATKAKPDPRVRWFGKLPTYADYYSSPTDEDWAVEFNAWIMDGYGMYLARQQQAGGVKRLPSAACILRLPKSQMTVFASFQDYGGDMRGRPFPLCFYVGLPSALWPGPTSDRILTALRLLRDVTSLRDLVIRFFNAPGRFETIFGGREFDLAGIDEETTDDSWVLTARGLALADWFSAARECLSFDDADAWFQATSAWGDKVAKLESDEIGPTLRFPIVMALPPEAQAAGWLRWLEHRLDLKRRSLSLLISYEAGSAAGRFSVIARDPVPEDFLLMTSFASRLTYLDDLSALAPVASSEPPQQAPDDSQATAIVRAPATWADFVASAATI